MGVSGPDVFSLSRKGGIVGSRQERARSLQSPRLRWPVTTERGDEQAWEGGTRSSAWLCFGCSGMVQHTPKVLRPAEVPKIHVARSLGLSPEPFIFLTGNSLAQPRTFPAWPSRACPGISRCSSRGAGRYGQPSGCTSFAALPAAPECSLSIPDIHRGFHLKFAAITSL